MLCPNYFLNRLLPALMLLVLSATAQSDPVLTLSSDEHRLSVARLVIAGSVDVEDKHLQLRSLNKLMREERAKFAKEMSVDELHQIADKLTLYVRKRGYLFHTVYLPPQRVRNDVVQFSFQAAKLNDINVISSSKLDADEIKQYFTPFLNKSLYAPAIEKQVMALKAQHGVSLFAFYSRGAGNNAIRLNLKASRERRHSFSIKAENYGADTTGRNRVIADATFSGVSTSFDTLSLAVLKTAGSGDTLYGFLNYSRPFKNLKTVLNFGLGDTSYSLGSDFNALEMSGDSRTYRLSLDQNLYLSTQNFQKLFVGAYRKESRLDSGFDDSLASGEISEGITVGWGGNIKFSSSTSALNYSLEYAQGEFEEGVDDVASVSLSKFSYATQLSKQFYSASRFAIGAYLHVRGQHSTEPLPGIESMSLSGIYGVRGIAAGAYSSDVGWISSLDVRLPKVLKLGDKKPLIIVPSVFFDAAKGETLYQRSEFNTETRLSGWGLGLDLAWQALNAKLAWASPIEERVSAAGGSEQLSNDPQWILEVQWVH